MNQSNEAKSPVQGGLIYGDARTPFEGVATYGDAETLVLASEATAPAVERKEEKDDV